ncbi:DUF1003 domain-containing protein [Microbacterium sp. SLBN-146]|uniref:DUF1003 domain-containing protein n=1 Tax=Microbacterium sp. SLBN-146 TaxID=2768457 RepID=UPI0011676DC3|nr:DUF1003 domain-containing protein [Microbacterium sp. SLBN-146]TQJ31055.1 putative membrane protein [Microbacterium sp. SLBN-146]
MRNAGATQSPSTDSEPFRGDAERPISPAARHPFNWHDRHLDSLTRGERAADRLRNGMGSWAFIAGFVAFMLLWAVVNVMDVAWDPYPYILLNLFLSMLAGLQGAILLIAAKRQDAIAAALAQHDYETNVSAKRELEELMEMNRAQLDLIVRIHQRMPDSET